MSTIIISFLFFLSSFNIASCIIRDCCSDFRRWWKDGIKKVEIEWLFFISISFSIFSLFAFIFVQVVLHINWQNWISVIHQHERRVLCRRMSTNAMRKKDPLDNLWPYFKIIFQNLYQRVLYCSVLTFCQSFRLRVIISKLGSHLWD